VCNVVTSKECPPILVEARRFHSPLNASAVRISDEASGSKAFCNYCECANATSYSCKEWNASIIFDLNSAKKWAKRILEVLQWNNGIHHLNLDRSRWNAR
jgi:hypothetical protein